MPTTNLNISFKSSASLNSTKPLNTKTSKDKKEETKDNKAKLALALTALGALAIAGIAIYRSKAVSKELPTKLFSDIEYKDHKGIAYLGDEKFTGVISDNVPNSTDKIILEYKDGLVQKSTREGAKPFEKIYEYDLNNEISFITIKDSKGEELFSPSDKANDKLRELAEQKAAQEDDSLPQNATTINGFIGQALEVVEGAENRGKRFFSGIVNHFKGK